jgi:hypothetical protein
MPQRTMSVDQRREEVERTEQREDELRQEITEERSEWKNETRSKLFSQSP